MIIPPRIAKGDSIGIIAPARFISRDAYEPICRYINERGYKPVLGRSTQLEHGIFAGSDDERAADLQQMIADDNIKAILCVRGGYGCIRIADKTDFTTLVEKPKWIAGFSDVTVLHSILQNIGVASVHGQMPVNFTKSASSADALFCAMEGADVGYTFNSDYNRSGQTCAEVCGGNLSIICSLMGTPYQPRCRNKILFIEDVCEPLYRIDRMMQQLRASGLLAEIDGLVVGYFSDCEDSTPSFGMCVEDIINDAVAGYKYPVAFGLQAGHQHPNMPLLLGCRAQLSVDGTAANLQFGQS